MSKWLYIVKLLVERYGSGPLPAYGWRDDVTRRLKSSIRPADLLFLALLGLMAIIVFLEILYALLTLAGPLFPFIGTLITEFPVSLVPADYFQYLKTGIADLFSLISNALRFDFAKIIMWVLGTGLLVISFLVWGISFFRHLVSSHSITNMKKSLGLSAWILFFSGLGLHAYVLIY